jgi:hypothetical protein
MINRPDKQIIDELTKLAKYCHKKFSREIANALIDRILSVSNVRCLNKVISIKIYAEY